MAKSPQQRTFNDVLSILGNQKFDVAAAQEGAQRSAGAVRVSKYHCAAEIAPSAAGKSGAKGVPVPPVSMTTRSGYLLGGEISRLVDRGYQKFLKTSKLEIPATAEHLRALHDFVTELDAATGEMNLYNEALGTTSDKYEYDRVLGRPDQPTR
jgi:hypothetical protein